MALVQWHPWTGMEALRREVDRLFETHVAEMFGNGDPRRVTWAPRLDVRELDHAFVVEADLPGMRLEDITSLSGKQHASHCWRTESGMEQ